MFFKKKEETELLQKTLDAFEKNQKNNELLVQYIYQMVAKDKPEESNEEIDKLKAAYALNLCMVSVSQIIDYADGIILEQEYETILNNLNLEHMPKDEALLNVLKQLLDTITYFRIHESDKKLVEKEYQQKMKDAIWASVPNFGLIVAGGSPVTMALSLASQVGISYMNYRKIKADNLLEKERKDWELQRGAIEQFNGLRRELFDASWRLAATYEFPDEYRLTECQIEQYNRILMDTDEIRRYERLEAIENNFQAYPPFWYHFGHAANQIAQTARMESDTDTETKYTELAKTHFKKFSESNQYPLLREDHIASSCALEYIDLLDPIKDESEIAYQLSKAEKSSGMKCDILQLCAMNYLKIKKYDEAQKKLKYLINEDYNAVMNSQLLSSLLVYRYIEEGETDYLTEYKILSKKIDISILFPLPPKTILSENNKYQVLEALKHDYIEKQKALTKKKYLYVIRHYKDICTVAFNRAIPNPYEAKEYPDFFYLDYDENILYRKNEYEKVLVNQGDQENLKERLICSDFALTYLSVFNSMLNQMEILIPNDLTKNKQEIIEEMVITLEKEIKERKNCLNNIINKIKNDKYGVGVKEAIDDIFTHSFDEFTSKFFYVYLSYVKKHINNFDNMMLFSQEDTLLKNFCTKYNIPEFQTTSLLYEPTSTEFWEDTIYFESSLLGVEAHEKATEAKKAKKMAHELDKLKNDILNENDQKSAHIYTRLCEKKAYQKYFAHKLYFSELRNSIFGVLIVPQSFTSKQPLVFTTTGVFLDKNKKIPEIYAYTNIRLSETEDSLILKSDSKEEKYARKGINLTVLNELIQRFATIQHEEKNPAEPPRITENK